MVSLRRGTAYADQLRVYLVLVDGARAGKIGDSGTLTISVPPGRHTIQLKIDWCSSEAIDFEVREGDVVKFQCGPILTGWRLLLGFVYITVRRHQYVWLRRV